MSLTELHLLDGQTADARDVDRVWAWPARDPPPSSPRRHGVLRPSRVSSSPSSRGDRPEGRVLGDAGPPARRGDRERPAGRRRGLHRGPGRRARPFVRRGDRGGPGRRGPARRLAADGRDPPRVDLRPGRIGAGSRRPRRRCSRRSGRSGPGRREERRPRPLLGHPPARREGDRRARRRARSPVRAARRPRAGGPLRVEPGKRLAPSRERSGTFRTRPSSSCRTTPALGRRPGRRLSSFPPSAARPPARCPTRGRCRTPGATALALSRSLGDVALPGPAQPDLVAFNVGSERVVTYPAAWSRIGGWPQPSPRRSSSGSASSAARSPSPGLGTGVLLFPVAILVASAVAARRSRSSSGGILGGHVLPWGTPHSAWFSGGLLALGVAVVAALDVLFRVRRATPRADHGLAAAGLIWGAGLALVAGLRFPDAAYLAVVPAILLVPAFLILFSRTTSPGNPWMQATALAVAAVPAILILTPVWRLLDVASGWVAPAPRLLPAAVSAGLGALVAAAPPPAPLAPAETVALPRVLPRGGGRLSSSWARASALDAGDRTEAGHAPRQARLLRDARHLLHVLVGSRRLFGRAGRRVSLDEDAARTELLDQRASRHVRFAASGSSGGPAPWHEELNERAAPSAVPARNEGERSHRPATRTGCPASRYASGSSGWSGPEGAGRSLRWTKSRRGLSLHDVHLLLACVVRHVVEERQARPGGVPGERSPVRGLRRPGGWRGRS